MRFDTEQGLDDRSVLTRRIVALRESVLKKVVDSLSVSIWLKENDKVSREVRPDRDLSILAPKTRAEQKARDCDQHC